MVIIMMMVHMVPYMVIKTMKINYRYIKLNPPKDAAQNVPKTSNAAIKADLISKVNLQHCQHRLNLINRDDDDSDPGRSKETWETASEEASVVPTIVIAENVFTEIFV